MKAIPNYFIAGFYTLNKICESNHKRKIPVLLY